MENKQGQICEPAIVSTVSHRSSHQADYHPQTGHQQGVGAVDIHRDCSVRAGASNGRGRRFRARARCGRRRVCRVRGQLSTNGQRGRLELGEGVVAAIGTSIDREHHALAAVGSSSVCTLATINPNGLSLRGREEGSMIRNTSSPIWQQALKRGSRRSQ